MLWLWVGANDGEGSGVNPPGGNGMAVWRREVAAAMTRAAEGDVSVPMVAGAGVMACSTVGG